MFCCNNEPYPFEVPPCGDGLNIRKTFILTREQIEANPVLKELAERMGWFSSKDRRNLTRWKSTAGFKRMYKKPLIRRIMADLQLNKW